MPVLSVVSVLTVDLGKVETPGRRPGKHAGGHDRWYAEPLT